MEYDGRLKELRLTEKALDFAERVWQGLKEFEMTITEGLTQRDQEVLLTLLRKLEENVSAAGKKEGSAVC